MVLLVLETRKGNQFGSVVVTLDKQIAVQEGITPGDVVLVEIKKIIKGYKKSDKDGQSSI